jgi:hypothetical protein
MCNNNSKNDVSYQNEWLPKKCVTKNKNVIKRDMIIKKGLL